MTNTAQKIPAQTKKSLEKRTADELRSDVAYLADRCDKLSSALRELLNCPELDNDMAIPPTIYTAKVLDRARAALAAAVQS